MTLFALVLACGTAEIPHEEEVVPHGGTAARLDLNTATAAQFATIPGVGDRMVHEFLEYRPYVSIAQFRKEMAKYVDAGTIAGYEQHVYVPVDPAASDAATLLQLPGLVQAEADQLLAGRPYPDRQAFLDALAKHVTPAELDAGKGWIR